MPEPSARRRVMVVEDERPIRELLRFHLALAGLDVEEYDDGRAALERACEQRFDLLVLDLMLPHLDGISLCRAVRAGGPNQATPVLMLTAMDTESDKVVGLDSGGDDYVTKPFGIRELMARVRALLRRNPARDQDAAGEDDTGSRPLSAGAVSMDPGRRQTIVRGGPCDLTRQEFDLLYLLASHPGIVFSRAALIARVWGSDTYVTERTVDALVSRLRRKIEEDPQRPAVILTEWAVGYKFADSGPAS